jgi:hypothetical protein
VLVGAYVGLGQDVADGVVVPCVGARHAAGEDALAEL